MSNTDETAILVDAHVHIYDCFDIDTLLNAASHNFKRAAKNLGLKNGFTGVFLLAETRNDNWFQRTRERCMQSQKPLSPGDSNRWQIYVTLDDAVLKARRMPVVEDSDEYIYIMAGRQIITVEGLELLALATDSTFDDGLSITSTLDVVREQGALPVLPWAVGKWLGRRGKILSSLLKNEQQNDFCLGDNSGRPVFWHNPSHFQRAQANKMRLLPGTDPLPFSSEAGRVGSFGFMMQNKLTKEKPSADLKRILRDNSLPVTPYGKLETPLRFIINQIRLRVA